VTPHNALITWACISGGGFQVNSKGRRLSNEALGYSEQAAEVMRQPGGFAYEIFDERIAAIARQFPDFRDAEKVGALSGANTIEELAALVDIQLAALASEFGELARARESRMPDRFGRNFSSQSELKPPYLAVKVTGALFHTQGGLMITPKMRVVRPSCGRRFRQYSQRLPVWQRIADGDRVRPVCRRTCRSVGKRSRLGNGIDLDATSTRARGGHRARVVAPANDLPCGCNNHRRQTRSPRTPSGCEALPMPQAGLQSARRRCPPDLASSA
jgi:hypothetical protein